MNYEKLSTRKIETAKRAINIKPLRTYGPAWYARHKGISLVYLKGSGYDMGRQHGELLKQEITSGLLEYYSTYLNMQAEHTMPRALADFGLGILNMLLLRRIALKLPQDDLAPYIGIGDALRVKHDLLGIIANPDIMQYVVGIQYRNRLTKKLPQPLLGCTSFVAKGKATNNGHVIFGHNKDYPAMEYWDKHPTVFFCEPDGKYRYIMLATPVIHSASMHSLNEHGLSFTVHTVLTADVSLSGTPLLVVGRRVMENARNVKEAINILSNTKFMVGWNLLLADKSGDVATVETSGSRVCVRFWEDEAEAFSNVYRNPAHHNKELTISPAIRANLEARYVRMQSLAKEKFFGNISPETAPLMLSDTYDLYTNTHRPVGNIIAQNQNVMSSIMDLNTLDFWIADGAAPTCYSTYRGFNFEDGFKKKASARADFESPYIDTDHYRSVRRYILAEHVIQHTHDYKEAARLLEEACELFPEEILYHGMLGIVYTFAREFSKAETSLRTALTKKGIPHRKAFIRLWLARTLDLAGKRREAKKQYKQLWQDKSLDLRLRKAAKKGLSKRFCRRGIKRFNVDFWMGDALDY